MDARPASVEQQLRKYKERVQNHKGEATLGGSSYLESESPQSSEGTGSDDDGDLRGIGPDPTRHVGCRQRQ